jgi:hypothetical protein
LGVPDDKTATQYPISFLEGLFQILRQLALLEQAVEIIAKDLKNLLLLKTLMVRYCSGTLP